MTAQTQTLNPAPTLLDSYKAIVKALSERTTEDQDTVSLILNDTNVAIDAPDSLKNQAHKMLLDIQLAYTKGTLSPLACKNIIERHLPRQFNQSVQSQTLAIPEKFARADIAALDMVVDFFKEKKNNTEIQVNAQNRQITLNGDNLSDFEIARRTITEVIKSLEEGKRLTNNAARHIYTKHYQSVKTTTDPRLQERLIRKKEKTNRIFTHSVERLDDVDGTQLVSLAHELLQKRSASALKELEKLQCTVTPIQNQQETALEIHFPVYTNEEQTAEAKARIAMVVKEIAEEFATGKHQKIDGRLINNIIKNTNSKRQSLQQKENARKTPANNNSALCSFRINELDSLPAAPFARYLLGNKRLSALEAIAERDELDFTVSVDDSGSEPTFVINLKSPDGSFDETQFLLAKMLLNQLYLNHRRGAAINKSFVRDFLATKIPRIQTEDSHKKLGDRLAVAFTKRASEKAAALAPPVQQDFSAGETRLALSAAEVFEQKFAPAVTFALPAFDDDGNLALGGEVLIPTENQVKLMNGAAHMDVVIAHAPPGSGKTFWAVYMALKGLKEGRYQKICITAPAVEAEEKLGFMPGNMNAKMGPHINQILEHIDEFLGNGNGPAGMQVRQKLMSAGALEIAPHAFNRGKTYKNTFYLLDESQNASWKQLKTAIERLGEGSTFLFLGDDKQNDRTNQRSAYSYFMERLSTPEFNDYIYTLRMDARDVKRHPLVKKLIETDALETPEGLNDEAATNEAGYKKQPRPAAPSVNKP